MKFVKTGLRPLLNIRLEIFSLDMAHFIIKAIQNYQKKQPLFSIFFKTEYLLDRNYGLAKIINLLRPQKQTKAAEMGKSSF